MQQRQQHMPWGWEYKRQVAAILSGVQPRIKVGCNLAAAAAAAAAAAVCANRIDGGRAGGSWFAALVNTNSGKLARAKQVKHDVQLRLCRL
jgi:hypothetical protein